MNENSWLYTSPVSKYKALQPKCTSLYCYAHANKSKNDSVLTRQNKFYSQIWKPVYTSLVFPGFVHFFRTDIFPILWLNGRKAQAANNYENIFFFLPSLAPQILIMLYPSSSSQRQNSKPLIAYSHLVTC